MNTFESLSSKNQQRLVYVVDKAKYTPFIIIVILLIAAIIATGFSMYLGLKSFNNALSRQTIDKINYSNDDMREKYVKLFQKQINFFTEEEEKINSAKYPYIVRFNDEGCNIVSYNKIKKKIFKGLHLILPRHYAVTIVENKKQHLKLLQNINNIKKVLIKDMEKIKNEKIIDYNQQYGKIQAFIYYNIVNQKIDRKVLFYTAVEKRLFKVYGRKGSKHISKFKKIPKKTKIENKKLLRMITKK